MERPEASGTPAETEYNGPQDGIAFNSYTGGSVFMPAPKEKTVFSFKDSVFSLLALMLGFLFSRFVLWGQLGASVTVFFCLPLGDIRLLYGAQPHAFFRMDGGAYFVFTAFRSKGKIKKGFLRDAGSSLFTTPLSNFGACPGAASRLFSRTRGGKLKWVLLGLLIAVPVTAVAAALLISGDVMFRSLMPFPLENFWTQALLVLIQAAFGIPAAFWFFGLLHGSKNKKEQAQPWATHKKGRVYLRGAYAALYFVCAVFCGSVRVFPLGGPEFSASGLRPRGIRAAGLF